MTIDGAPEDSSGAAPLLVRVDGGVSWLTLNRPADANTINLATARAFRDAIARAAGEDARAIVIAGAGGVFCGGGDVREMADAADLPAYVTELAGTFHEGLALLSEIDAVIVAAVDGAAAGGGLGLALNADVIVASDRAVFLTAYEGVSLTPDSGTSFLLPRAVGLPRALAMSTAGLRLDAREAERIGLVRDVVSPERVEAAAAAIAKRAASRPRGHIAATRRLYRGSEPDAYRRHLAEETRAIGEAARGADAARLIRAFSARGRKDDRA